jgi:hypothetical protein
LLYKRSANGARIDVQCTAKVLKFGKSLIYGVAECRNNSDTLLTHHAITYMRIEK